MHEISILLKNRTQVTNEEARILKEFSCPGKIWSVIHSPTKASPYYMRQRSLEYILDSDSYLMFRIVSQNIFLQWDTEHTKNLKVDEIYYMKESLFMFYR